MNAIVSWIIARLTEPSTWAGVALFGTSAEHLIQSGNITVATVVTAIGGFLATVVSESSTSKGS